MARYKDFDAFWAEKKQEPIKFRALGEEFTLPSSLPAEVVLKVIRMQREGRKKDEEIDEVELMQLLLDILGKNNLQKLTKKGLTIAQMEDLLVWLIEEYTGTEVDPNQLAEKKGEMAAKLKK